MKAQKVRKLRLPAINLELPEFPLTRPVYHGAPPKIPAPTGDPQEVWLLFKPQIDAFNRSLGGFAPLPFAWPTVDGRPFGDFTGIRGDVPFRHIRARLDEGPEFKQRPKLATNIIDYSVISQALSFYNGDRCTCLQGIRRLEGGALEFTIGVEPYITVFGSMSSQGVQFTSGNRQQIAAIKSAYGENGGAKVALLNRLVKKLQKRFGDVTIREALHAYYKGELPPFGSPFVNLFMGSAVLVTTADEHVILGRRTPGNVSVNFGINVASSGGFNYDAEEIKTHGFSSFVEAQIRRELLEELGVPGNACTVTVLAFVREVARAGAPDFIGFVEFNGTHEELVHLARNNKFPNLDVDTLYAIPFAQARDMILRPNITKVIHEKAVLALTLWSRYHSIRS
ncbi:MAG: hypothetical protein A2758_03205 [Candidatus Zambryskibacteria bacterium RIFCSPHIGHO2_01_FULL_49_18]|uniref:Nudix hydrolase domain-containing protein n=1 Tax=Candidatus Zambryskibacteria bacterium RIFCSPHIGHO2_01_FULL_49_18 TaxID=1802740 RepID=A0A1G2T380_9BACT|nr:MAG: hypothetical protein A2758_03205 [Candidatus Zambryskibacteria bacterium RIFCSPHIGHO2_01_FULL_49_18]